jgi:hypothetical protein
LSGHASVRARPFPGFGIATEAGPIRTTVGIDGIALSPDERTLWWTQLGSYDLYSVDTDILSAPHPSPEMVERHVVRHDTRDFASDGLDCDREGRVYFTDVMHGTLQRFIPTEQGAPRRRRNALRSFCSTGNARMRKTRIIWSASLSLALLLLAAAAPTPAPAGPPASAVLTAQDIQKATPAKSIPPVSSDPDDNPAGAGALQGMAAPNASCDSKPPGKERWPIKTSLPVAAPPATALDTAMANAVDIAVFMKASNVGKIGPAYQAKRYPKALTLGSTSPKEGDLVGVTGFVRSIGCEGDGDFHVNISTSRSVTTCAVVEVPNPTALAQSSSSAFVKQKSAALRTTLAKMYAAAGTNKATYPKVTFAGQLFYDGTHYNAANPGGGRGAQLQKGTPCATTLWELHPALAMRVVPG